MFRASLCPSSGEQYCNSAALWKAACLPYPVNCTVQAVPSSKNKPTICHCNLKFISWLIEPQHVSGIIMPIIRRTILPMTACTLCSPLTSQLHTTTTRQTPHAVIGNIVLLMMGMMTKTCWGSVNHEINFRLQWHLVGSVFTWRYCLYSTFDRVRQACSFPQCCRIASETPKSPSLHGRQQAGNVKSLIQQAVIQPCMKVSAQ